MGCNCKGKREKSAPPPRRVRHLGTMDPEDYRARVIAEFAASKKRAAGQSGS